MPNFIPIDKAQSLFMNEDKKNTSICATVIKIGDLKSGTSAKGDWTNKDITLKDESGLQILTAWNDDIKKFELNHIYKFEKPFWTMYDGKPQLSLGKYCTVTLAATEPVKITTTLEQVKPPLSILDEFTHKIVKNEAEFIVHIKSLVEDTVKIHTVDPHPGMIWEMTTLIWKKYFEEPEK